MTDPKEFRLGRGYTREDWDDVSDNPEWTEEDFANAKPFAQVFPDLAASIERERGRKPDQKEVAFHLEADVLAKFEATGEGWQARVNDVLRRASIEDIAGKDR